MGLGLFIKKTITFFIEPFGLILTLLVIGIYFLFTNKQKYAKLLISLSFIFMLLFSYPPFANYLVQNLEMQYSQYNYESPVKYIHVLGSGHITDDDQPISSKISSSGLKRVLEGIIIHKNTPNSKIIFTGYEGSTNETNAKMNLLLALALGVNLSNMIINGIPDDTRMEAAFTKTLVGDEPFILVTSATHMPRAMILFRSMGMNPIPAPTDFHSSQIESYLKAPTIRALQNSRIAIHEYIGMLWAKIRMSI